MDVKLHPRGSEWRRWDLHVHAPGTKTNDGYAKKSGQLDWQQFCEIVHESDVAVIGIADYFSLDSYFEVVEQYQHAFPGDDKIFLPNLELRIPEVLNDAGQSVNLHLIFPPTLTKTEAQKFLVHLTTEITVGKSSKEMACSDLSTPNDFQSATVSRASIENAIVKTFGKKAIRQDHVLIVTSAKGDGIRVGGKGSKKRKASLQDEIDKFSDAFFAGPGSRDYFLDTDRLEDPSPTPPKPVFGGCDAHTFDALRAGLGKHNAVDGSQQHITWIKADPGYEGLLQTLIEPADRVAIQAVEPDQKEPYKVIAKVAFSGTNDFPDEIVFNRNLNAIIGSRSSGKSALLAFIAHAVDPEGTVRIQVDASKAKEKEVGPAAGKTWADVTAISCEVEWESGGQAQGRVIYIPQNSLYEISEHPDKVTQKIAPALFRTYPEVKTAHERAVSKVAAANDAITSATSDWFNLADRVEALVVEIRDLGDKDAIVAERDRLQNEIDQIKTAAQLTDDEVAKYQNVAGQLQGKRARLSEIAVELDQLSTYVVIPEAGADPTAIPDAVQVTLSLHPLPAELPEALSIRIDEIKAKTRQAVLEKVEQALADAVKAAIAERATLSAEIDSLQTDNEHLIAKHEANEELSRVVEDHKKQLNALLEIEKREKSRDKLLKQQGLEAGKIAKALGERSTALDALEAAFRAEARTLDDLTFGIETDVSEEVLDRISLGFNQKRTSPYIPNSGQTIDFAKAQDAPDDFLAAVRKGSVALNKGFDAVGASTEVLTTAKEVRFTAELDEDRIGGFGRSSMTPGKQALFALTLILNESQEPWPLLIDQPEDDLDSRSIYDTIVPYLTQRKRERQIIMVSHNANLVIGADSEEVIVANRHGADRPNAGKRTFQYMSGSLEHSQARNDKSKTILGRYGIREHACEILDGGEEAFQKRREKYKI